MTFYLSTYQGEPRNKLRLMDQFVVTAWKEAEGNKLITSRFG